MEIVKVYKESVPKIRLVGKRYTNADRDGNGTFGGHWREWFQKGWFDILRQCERIPNVSDDYLGAMRMTGTDNGFEYWIGIFCAPGAEAPDGFESAEIAAGDLGVCWLYGNGESGELYGMEASDSSMAALKESGFAFSEKGWFLERYNCPRFTAPDEKGNVILDICAYLI